MRRQNRTIFGNITCLLLGVVLFLPSTAFPADLKYIRIGEHKDFTRVVFEFRGPVSYKPSEIKGEGVLSVVFPDTKTSLPPRIDSETAKWVDTIEFTPQKTDLVAKLTFAFRYYSVKAFSLSNPERVVLDIKETGEPKRGAIVEESVEKVVEAAKPAQKPLVKEEKVEPAKVPTLVITPPETVMTQQPETPPKAPSEVPPEAPPEAPNERQEDLPLPTSTLPVEPVASEPPQQVEQPTPEPVLEPEEQPEAEKETAPTEDLASEQGGVPWSFVKIAQTEGYLLTALVSLSAVIVGLLVYIVFRKRRRTDKVAESEEPVDSDSSDSFIGLEESADEGVAEESGDIDESIAAIDARIREALKKI